MRIIKLRFEDKTSGWVLDEMLFHPKLTLLVGASGVGKTQILRAVKTLARIAGGESFRGATWDIEFETIEGKKYQWIGEYKTDADFLIHEKIILENTTICQRTENKTYFKGVELPKLQRHQSLLMLIGDEMVIWEAYKCFFNVSLSTADENEGVLFFKERDYDEIKNEGCSLEEIQESNWSIISKLFVAYSVNSKSFDIIISRFLNIFTSVESIRFIQISEQMGYHQLQLKEKGVPNWIPQDRISSGMYKTLMHLAELYLCADGTVFLIDEFENSLGINCINEITADIINSKRRLQFIITSHHPYIINSIDFEYWKLVTRDGSITRTHDAADLGLGKSKHERFMQLLQLEEYQTGSSQK